MTLARGARLGPYEIQSAIGAGGMGEVYKARDTRLDRSVAIKILPTHFSADPERRVRFEREARTIAGLSHPHICPLFDVGEHGGSLFLVMEYLSGESLARRLERGPMPVEEALAVAAQIADALAAAHHQGVIHRDLKPGNVMLTGSGAKLVDFGLAKLRQHGERPVLEGDTSAPTRAEPVTAEGAIVGTLQYMAPEQLEGKPADARTDLWALGVVIYEMVTGRRAFDGATAATVIGSILHGELPALSSTHARTPLSLDHVIARCLAKKPEDRWESAHDVADELQWIGRGGQPPEALPPAPSRRRWLAAFAVILALAGAASLYVAWRAPWRTVTTARRFVLGAPPGIAFGGYQGFAFSPAADALVYEGDSQDGSGQRLYWQDLNEDDSHALAGTNGASEPFFSPDGAWLGYMRGNKLVKAPLQAGRIVEGSPVADLADVTAWPRGASWCEGGTVVYSPQAYGGLWIVPAGGGPARELTRPDRGRYELSHRWPECLPGGRAALFTILHASGRQDRSAIAVVSLASGRVTRVVESGTYARLAPTGHLVYARNGWLLAVPFDARSLAVTGSPVPFLGGVAMEAYSGTGAVSFALSGRGTLAYAQEPPRPKNTLVWVDRDGDVEPVAPEARTYEGWPTLSPDGRKLAIEIRGDSYSDLWLYDLEERRWQQVTFTGDSLFTAWSPAGDRLAFSSNREGAFNIFLASVDGDRSVRRLTTSPNWQFPYSWSPDGRFLAYQEQDETIGWNTWIAPVDGKGAPFLWGPKRVGATEPAFSPDGRVLAYQSEESGQWDVYLRPFPGSGSRLRVSAASGGHTPVWSRDGRTIFFLDGTRIMAAAVGAGAPPTVSPPHLAFAIPFALDPTDDPYHATFRSVAPDGRRVPLVRPDQQVAPGIKRLVVISDWRDELSAKAPPAARR